MKHFFLAVALICFGSSVNAAPYFRLINLAHPQPVAGALIDPTELGNSEAAALLPIITHTPKDGCLFPSIVCEDWTPLAIGGSINAGKLTFDVAPLANVLPWMQAVAKAIIPRGWSGLRSVVEYDPTGDAIMFSAGPCWQYRQITNKGYFKIFTGLALKF